MQAGSEQIFLELKQIVREVSTRKNLPRFEAQGWLAKLPELSSPKQLSRVAKIVGPLFGRCNWSRYRWQEQQLAAGALQEDLETAWRNMLGAQSAAFDELAASIAVLKRPIDENREELLRTIRELEVTLGFPAAHVQDVISAIGPKIFSTRGSSSLIECLPDALARPYRSNPSGFGYDHDLHAFLLDLLRRIGPTRRKSRAIVALCGTVLSEFFPDDDTQTASSASFRQAIYLTEDFIERQPGHPVALLWRAELACWQRDESRVDELCRSLRKALTRLRNDEALAVLHFLENCVEGVFALEPGAWWNSPPSPGQFGHVGSVEVKRRRKRESLVTACIRRIFAEPNWDARMLAVVAAIANDVSCRIPFDVLRSYCWIWLAECSDLNDLDPTAILTLRYHFWENAYRAAIQEGDEHNVLASAVVLLGAYLVDPRTALVSSDLPIGKLVRGLKQLSQGTSLSGNVEACISQVLAHFERDAGRLSADDRLAMLYAKRHWKAPAEPNSAVTDSAIQLRQMLSRSEQHSLRVFPNAGDGAAPAMQVTIAEGDASYVLRSPGFRPFSLAHDEKKMFGLFVQKVLNKAPHEIVELRLLNIEAECQALVDDGRAGDLLRKKVAKLNLRLLDWRSTPDGKPWIISERGRGYKLNESVEWTVDEQLQMELKHPKSVRDRATNPKEIEETNPQPNQRLPARPRRDKKPDRGREWDE